MIYDIVIEDVHGDWHHYDDPIEAATPWDALQKALDWSRSENIMPKSIDAEPAVCAKGSPDAEV